MSSLASSLQAWVAIAESAVLCIESDTISMQNRTASAISKLISDVDMVYRAISLVCCCKAATATRYWLARQKQRDQVIEDLLSCEKFLIATDAMCEHCGSSPSIAACAQNSLHAAEADLVAATACLDLQCFCIDGSQFAHVLSELSIVCG